MKQKSKFSIKARLKSFIPAFNGIKLLFRNEHNSWVHLTFTFFVIGFGFSLQLNNYEWVFIAFAIGLVFLAELLNTAIERLADHVEPNFNTEIGAIKDYASAAVLIASILAVVIGLLIFVPKINATFNHLIN